MGINVCITTEMGTEQVWFILNEAEFTGNYGILIFASARIYTQMCIYTVSQKKRDR